MEAGDYHGLSTRRISGEHITIEVLAEAGPRIVRLYLSGSEDNLLQELADRKKSTPYGDFFNRGGHRLWHAPEAFPRTYIPDNSNVEVESTRDGIRLRGPVEPHSYLQKSMEIKLDPDRPSLTIEHSLQNQGLWAVDFAPWALTVLPLGGLAIFPQQIGQLDPAGLLPNRNLVVWPYASLRDERLQLDDQFIFIKASSKTPPLKIGYMNRSGWIGYLRRGVFFVKRFTPLPELPHVDFGCNVESYINDRFIELETLGPLASVEPGESLKHIEVWELYKDVQDVQDFSKVQDLAASLNLP